MKKGWAWPLAIVGLLALCIGANGLLLVRAVGDPSFAVEPDYYAKAIAWDAHQRQARVNAELGWSVDVEVAPAELSTGRAQVTARLRDRAGRDVEGAVVTLEAFHNARAAAIVTAALEEATDHTYGAGAPIVRPGLWELRLTARRGADTFTAVIERDVPGWAR